jgi:hypothetical protein
MIEYTQCQDRNIALWTLELHALLIARIIFSAVGLSGMGAVGVIMTIDAVTGSANAFVKAMAMISWGL